LGGEGIVLPSEGGSIPARNLGGWDLKSVRWPLWGRRLQAGGLALAIAGAVLWAGTPAGAAAAISVDPSTDLADGQQVTVTLTGWLPEPAQVLLLQCEIGAQEIGLCDAGLQDIIYFDLDGSGTATHSYTVKVSGICNATRPCSLFALENPQNFGGPNASEGQRSASVEIAFNATATTTSTVSSSTTTSTSTTSTSTSSTTTTTRPSTTTSSTTSTTSPIGGSSKSTRAEATPTDPVATKVTSPVAGTIDIKESKSPAITAPAGMTLLGADVQITAPAATATNPLAIEFRLDTSLFPTAIDPVATLVVLHGGATVAACTGSPDAIPDPCVDRKVRSGDDTVVTVLSSRAGAWNFALPASTSATTTSTTARQVAGPVVASPATPTGTGTGASTLPRTGTSNQAMWLLAFGVALATSGSVVRRHALHPMAA
jgi:LPXTG-motif cell wall-anchored protein